MHNAKVIPVRVALRCRPMSPREGADGCQMCVSFVRGEPQVVIGKEKAFTYDYVFGPTSSQEEVYGDAVSNLVKGVFKGYNATVLAYGQTGSGKTHTMGGGWGEHSGTADEVGIIPRVIGELFEGIEEAKERFSFVVRVSYLELYKETLIDLLTPRTEQDHEGVIIREDPNGGIKLTGLQVVDVTGEEDMLAALSKGALSRTTGATAMNSVSSRSHAIFTIHVERTSKADSNDVIKAKFHLVDLAGSERAKRTQAQGDRFKEGVNINLGLLALGNVISALGDESQKNPHIPYRNSKLTRLLQDSLGGNSLTLMIACVSPADYNMEETLTTMRYADRARQIKNKPIVNRDPQAAEILRLKQLVQSLQDGGAEVSAPSGDFEDTKQLRDKITGLMEKNLSLSQELHNSVDQNTHMCERLIIAETTRDSLKGKLASLKEKTGLSITMMLNKTEEEEDGNGEEEGKRSIGLLQELQQEMEQIEKQDDVVLSDILGEELQDDAAMTPGGSTDAPHSPDGTPDSALQDHALRQAKLSRELQGLNEMLVKKERLASEMLQNDGQMNAMKEQYERTMKELEREVLQLHREKDDLLSAHNVTKSANPALSKVSEQRRKRLQELEAKMTELKAKITEQGRMLKVKEISVKQCEKLGQEIQGMKHQRVKLMKQMKDDSDNFRRWKQAKEKEVTQLKAKDRKRQVEMTKLEMRHERQQSVMKRKAEEATLANKRLKDALAKQKLAAKERHDRLAKKDMSGIGARVRKWLGDELEVLVCIAEAKRHLQQAIDDRKELTVQMRDCESKLELDPPAKKSLLNDSSTHDADASHQGLRDEMDRLEQEVELRNIQISELQQKLMDADQEEKARSRWDNVHTMVEAKCGLKWLLTMAVESKVESSWTEGKLERVRECRSESEKEERETQASIARTRKDHAEELATLREEYERKVLFLLKQLQTSDSSSADPGAADEELRERLVFQTGEIERLGSLQERFELKSNECNTLKKELTVAMYTGDVVKTPLMPRMDRDQETPVYLEDESGEENSILDDADDPDYVFTPLLKRRTFKFPKGSIVASRPAYADRVSCGCQGNCKTKLCRCQKAGQRCGVACRCTDCNCVNRTVEEPVSTTSDDLELVPQSMDSTFCISERDDSGSTAEASSVLPSTSLFPARLGRTTWEKRSGNFTLPMSVMSVASEGSEASSGEKEKEEKRKGEKGRKRRLGHQFDTFLE